MNTNLFTEKKNKIKEADEQIVVNAENVFKSFRLFKDKPSSLKEAALKGLKKRKYSNFTALQDISFNVRKGSTLGIIGENGSGKSTLLKILTGVYKPDAGKVEVEGKISGLLELGAGFHPDLTGRENIYLNASILGMKRKDVDLIFDDIVAFSEIPEFIDTAVKHYSSGMFVRLGFAVAINIDPNVLVIDEVLAVGDEHFQRKCSDKILQFKREGKTIIIVSHALAEIRSICDDALWLHKGKLKASGPAERVIDTYLKSVNIGEEKLVEDRADSVTKFGSRWGSGEAKITGIQFSDEKGKTKRLFKTGEPMVVKISYEANEKIEKPVFGFAIHTDQGVHLTGPNTRLSGNIVDYIEGKGQVEYHIEALPVLKGKYLCSAAIYDYSCLKPYDHNEEMYYFEVIDGPIKEGYGVMHIPAEWKIK